MDMKGRVLVVAGSDSGGGAGIQADIKTITALNGFAMTAITAITAQDTRGVHGVWPVPIEGVIGQMQVTLADIGADAIKTGGSQKPDVAKALTMPRLQLANMVKASVDFARKQLRRRNLKIDRAVVSGGSARRRASAASCLRCTRSRRAGTSLPPRVAARISANPPSRPWPIP